MNIVSRIAPTPNGEIHWGNLMNFVLIWVKLKQESGHIILRFDDIDSLRCKGIYASHTKEILGYIGLDFDVELSNQLSRKNDYFKFLQRLPHYTCACSRQDIFNRTGGYHYDGFCRSKNLSYSKEKNCIRFLSSHEYLDFILWRKEDLPAYHLTSVKDDLDTGVNTVIRGIDLLESTIMQTEMLKALGKNSIQFFHHRLISKSNGEKLSKSRKDGDLIKLVQASKPVSEILGRLAFLMGLEPTKFSSLDDFENLRFEDFLV